MNSPRKVLLGALLALLLAAGAGLVLTSDWVPQRRNRRAADAVDQKPLQTARALADTAVIPPEREFANQAIRLADHEVDLAFAAALRDAAERSAPTPQTKPLFARVQAAQERVAADNAQIARWTKALTSAPAEKQSDLQQQLALAQAQKELDDDELDDAREDLARAGGDTHSRIQRLLDEHNARHNAPELPVTAAQPVPAHLSAQVSLFRSLLAEREQLKQAIAEAQAKAAELTQRHNSLEKEGNAAQSQASPAPSDLTALKQLSRRQKTLGDLDKRIQDEQQLSDIYGRWHDLVERRVRATVHRILTALFVIVLIVLVLFLINEVVDRSLARMKFERRRLHTLRTVSRISAQALGLVLVLLVIFGSPSQLSTFIGLLSAGLAIILKDFIVAFLGWFVLMGKNGIRVGDWVEIEGVRGEVLEIGLLRTVLLETGGGSESGHPTGRKVAFVNSFAVEGHYFNFSTAGQWLWDELQVVVPQEENSYALAEQIHKAVAALTADNERLATEEWSRVPHHTGEFTPVTAMSLRPTPGGIEVTLRYVTRAYERAHLRARLYEAIMQMIVRPQVRSAASSQGATE